MAHSAVAIPSMSDVERRLLRNPGSSVASVVVCYLRSAVLSWGGRIQVKETRPEGGDQRHQEQGGEEESLQRRDALESSSKIAALDDCGPGGVRRLPTIRLPKLLKFARGLLRRDPRCRARRRRSGQVQ